MSNVLIQGRAVICRARLVTGEAKCTDLGQAALCSCHLVKL